MIEKIVDRRMMELVKKVFNHCSVIDVKLAIFQNDNCLHDPSTMTQLIKKELINKR